ncbi:hypothetical protein H9Q70_000021 [Fusarium xylarioides]|nr:hypothetical protein H9Q70_000021 [Fusarium xylarioides]KAG5782511.1 hypothetical protein H9Q73_003812 [Fusarium xylarioides]
MTSFGPPSGNKLRLPYGLVLKNRLVKSAISEKLAIDNLPVPSHLRMYRTWADGGWAALITGNITVDDAYLGTIGDVALSETNMAMALEKWSAWAQVAQGHNCHMIAQLSHPGRQSPIGAGKKRFFAKNIAPSAIPLNLGDNLIACCASAVVFGTPRAMTQNDIDQVIAAFASAAKMAFRAGFQGVEIHAGHGFLLSQFLSSSSNKRQDQFGGSPKKRCEIVLRVIRAIRDQVPATFCVGVKLNTADVRDTKEYDAMIRQISLIKDEKIDYINLSGGSFEDPKVGLPFVMGDQGIIYFMQPQMFFASQSISPTATLGCATQDPFFLQASHDISSKFSDLILILTGGFRSRAAVHSALESGACSIVGIGRPAIKYPDLPNQAFSQESS